MSSSTPIPVNLERSCSKHRCQHGLGVFVIPAQNASGNWVKVVQRIPVKIAI